MMEILEYLWPGGRGTEAEFLSEAQFEQQQRHPHHHQHHHERQHERSCNNTNMVGLDYLQYMHVFGY